MFFVRLRRRLPRYLFLACLALAAGMAGLVLAAPLLDGGGSPDDLAGRTLVLLARDVVVRRTVLAGAAGLLATGFIFFRPPYGRPPRSPTDVIGA
jgi:hypothetical protein